MASNITGFKSFAELLFLSIPYEYYCDFVCSLLGTGFAFLLFIKNVVKQLTAKEIVQSSSQGDIIYFRATLLRKYETFRQ